MSESTSSNGAAAAPVDSKPLSGFKGRPRADVWELFTESPNPQRLVSCVCRHCGVEVAHRKKSERAKAHLAKRCPPFRTLMLAIEDESLRPDWFNYLHTTTTRRKSDASATKPAAKRARVTPSASTASGVPTNASAPTKAEPLNGSSVSAIAVDTAALTAPASPAALAPVRSSAMPTAQHEALKQPQEGAGTLLHDQTLDATALAEQLALHIYVTGAPFSSIEDAFLLRAFQAAHPAAALPDREQLAGALLDACYDKVKAAVDRAAAASESATDTMEIAATPGARAIVRACALLIQSIFASPLTPKTSTTDASALEPLAAFVQDCRVVVALFMDDALLRSKLEHKQQTLNCAFLTPFPARAWTELPAWLDTIKSSEEIIYELATSHDFLASDKQSSQQRERVYRIITGESFFDDLDKCLQLLEPVRATVALAHAAADAATATASPISSAYYSACVTVRSVWEKLFCLSPVERTQLLALERSARLDAASCSDASVAYLLDPRYIGEGMASDERDSAEDFLFDFFDRTGSSTSTPDAEQQKEALYQEYTAFVIKRSSAKTAGGFRFQMLVKGTKTIPQFWLTDGRQFPLLQHVALAVFAAEPRAATNGSDAAPVQQYVTPVKTGSSLSRASPRSGVAPSPLSARRASTINSLGLGTAQLDKLAFIKAHAALLLQDEASSARSASK